MERREEAACTDEVGKDVSRPRNSVVYVSLIVVFTTLGGFGLLGPSSVHNSGVGGGARGASEETVGVEWVAGAQTVAEERITTAAHVSPGRIDDGMEGFESTRLWSRCRAIRRLLRHFPFGGVVGRGSGETPAVAGKLQPGNEVSGDEVRQFYNVACGRFTVDREHTARGGGGNSLKTGRNRGNDQVQTKQKEVEEEVDDAVENRPVSILDEADLLRTRLLIQQRALLLNVSSRARSWTTKAGPWVPHSPLTAEEAIDPNKAEEPGFPRVAGYTSSALLKRYQQMISPSSPRPQEEQQLMSNETSMRELSQVWRWHVSSVVYSAQTEHPSGRTFASSKGHVASTPDVQNTTHDRTGLLRQSQGSRYATFLNTTLHKTLQLSNTSVDNVHRVVFGICWRHAEAFLRQSRNRGEEPPLVEQGSAVEGRGTDSSSRDAFRGLFCIHNYCAVGGSSAVECPRQQYSRQAVVSRGCTSGEVSLRVGDLTFVELITDHIDLLWGTNANKLFVVQPLDFVLFGDHVAMATVSSAVHRFLDSASIVPRIHRLGAPVLVARCLHRDNGHATTNHSGRASVVRPPFIMNRVAVHVLRAAVRRRCSDLFMSANLTTSNTTRRMTNRTSGESSGDETFSLSYSALKSSNNSSPGYGTSSKETDVTEAESTALHTGQPVLGQPLVDQDALLAVVQCFARHKFHIHCGSW